MAQKRGGVVVAICDGAYNDEKSNGPRYKALEDLYRGHPELSLHLVAFDLDKEAEITTLTKLSEKTGGKFHNAPTAATLAQVIEGVMKPRPFSVVRNAEPPFASESNLGQPIDNLAPETYRVGFPGLRDFPATIVGGERLEFDLEISNKQLKHHRPVLKLSRRMLATRDLAPNEPTRFGYVKAEYDKTQRSALFQFSLDRDDASGMVERPKEIRIDVSPIGTTRQFSGSWKLVPLQSVPTWQIELTDWPVEAKPEIQAAWKMSRTEPDDKLPLARLMSEPQSISLTGWPDRGLIAEGERQEGKIILSLTAAEIPSGLSLADIRLELGEISLVESRFTPKNFNWTSDFYESQGRINFKFDVGEKFDPAKIHVALTSFSSLMQGTSRLQSPLEIEKWDGEQ